MIAIYGGRPYEPQIEALQKGVDVVVGTPGRLLDLAQQGHLQLGGLSMLVLDEADEMLDLGFLPDIERILRQIPANRQAMLFSATMPDPIITLARTFMNQPTHIRAEAPHSAAIHDTTEQFAYRAHALDKVEMVSRILQADGRGATMVFTRTKRTAQKVADELAERGFKVGAVHGDLGQGAREKALKAFRTGEIDVLVATDVAARGIDIDDITHVINYQIPEDEQAYVHRIGRTGRAGKTGIAVTLVDWDELPRWSMIDKALGLESPDPAETYSSSPHLYEELNIPADAGGSIGKPRAAAATSPSASRASAPARSPPATAAGAAPAAASPSAPPPTATPAPPSRPPRPNRVTPTGRARTHRVRAAAAVAVAPARPRTRAPTSSVRRSMVKPERRTRADMLAAAAIAGVVVLVAALVWWTSDARATVSRPAADPGTDAEAGHRGAGQAAPAVDGAERQDHRAPRRRRHRGHRRRPGDGGPRSPHRSDAVELRARPRPVRRHAGCTTTRSRSTPTCAAADRSAPWTPRPACAGRRAPATPTKHVRLSSDGTTVLSAGDTRLEMWRSDMVRMLSYGALDAPINPGKPASPQCGSCRRRPVRPRCRCSRTVRASPISG